MGSLRDELRKKGLVTDKKARATAHEEQVRRKRLGPQGVEAERRARAEEARRETERKLAEDRAREAERTRARQAGAEADRIPDLIRAGLFRDGAAGNRRFYFITRENTISYLEVSDVAARNLADGRLAIVESDGVLRQDFCLVASDTAQEIARFDPDRIRFSNRDSSAPPPPRNRP